MNILRRGIDYATVVFPLFKENLRFTDKEDPHLAAIVGAFLISPDAKPRQGFGKTVINDPRNGILIIQTRDRVFIHFKGRYWIKRRAYTRFKNGIIAIRTRFSCESYLTRIDAATDFVGDVMALPSADNIKNRWTGLSAESFYMPATLYSSSLVNRRQIMGNTRWVLQTYRKDLQLQKEKSREKRLYYARLFRPFIQAGESISRMELKLQHENACKRWGEEILKPDSTEQAVVMGVLGHWAKKHQLLTHTKKKGWAKNKHFKQLFGVA